MTHRYGWHGAGDYFIKSNPEKPVVFSAPKWLIRLAFWAYPHIPFVKGIGRRGYSRLYLWFREPE